MTKTGMAMWINFGDNIAVYPPLDSPPRVGGVPSKRGRWYKYRNNTPSASLVPLPLGGQFRDSGKLLDYHQEFSTLLVLEGMSWMFPKKERTRPMGESVERYIYLIYIKDISR